MIEMPKNNLLLLACISFLFTASSTIFGYSFMSGKHVVIAWLFIVLGLGNFISGILLVRKYRRKHT